MRKRKSRTERQRQILTHEDERACSDQGEHPEQVEVEPSAAEDADAELFVNEQCN